MFSISAIKGKFNRSKIDFNKTFLFDEHPNYELLYSVPELINNEKALIYYIDSPKYNWCLTNKRLFVNGIDKKRILLSDLTKVDLDYLKENPNSKNENKEITLHTNKDQFDLKVEDKSWHLFYNIFKFIISKNKKTDS